jgi:hypothetical protein
VLPIWTTWMKLTPTRKLVHEFSSKLLDWTWSRRHLMLISFHVCE